ncbi:MAG: hypothetical protein BRD48_01205 [Bacteroidetes bacterium QS_9_68_14]|nr:MAG: hypothetical protein BRD48_01205 [Bacteroidetes bacterium QS_9_68_14]
MRCLRASLALAFCVAALAAGCETPASDAPPGESAPAPTAEARSALAALPAETRFLAVADVQALRQGGIFDRKNASDLSGEAGARLRAFLDATGFGPAEDVRKVYLAAGGEALGGDASGDNAAMPLQMAVAADFDRARFEEELSSELGDRFEKSTYRSQPVYRSTRGGGNAEEQRAFAFTADGLIFLSTRAGVRQMLDRLETDGSAADSDRLMTLADRVRGRGSTWFVAQDLPPGATVEQAGGNSGSSSAGGAPPQRFQRLQQVVRDAVGAVPVLDRNAEGEVFLYTQEGAAPGDLREVLEGLVSAAGRSGDVSEQRQRLLDSIEIEEADDQSVRVTFSAPLDGQGGG